MSEIINNREYRQEVIKDIIRQLQDGKTVDEVKGQFEQAFGNVSASEIAEAEGALIREGLPIEEVQRLCDVHAAVFKGSIEEIHQEADKSLIPGHPANTLKRENRQIEKIIREYINPYKDNLSNSENIKALKEGFIKLAEVDIHYSKKENLMFPYLEKYGVTAPPQVMWGVDDEIREDIKSVIDDLSAKVEDTNRLAKKIDYVITKVEEMIFKEENILLPMLMDTLTQDEWLKIARESSEIGFLIDNVPVWNPTPVKEEVIAKENAKVEEGIINLPTGVLKLNELVHMLNTLPIDITFVDKDGVVKYFSESKERIFTRTKSVIGRSVTNCHPPTSVHVVEQIVEDFKSGKKDSEEFWIKMGDIYAYIRYFAVRDENNEYIGVIEVTQDIKPIQDITGEKRLMS